MRGEGVGRGLGRTSEGSREGVRAFEDKVGSGYINLSLYLITSGTHA